VIRTLLIVFVLLIAVPAAAQSSTPAPLPLPTQQAYEQLATANAQLNDVSADLTSPDGLPILPTEDGRVMFGYVKWLISPAAADEWAGPFAPIFQHINIGLGIVFALASVYSTVYIISHIGAWVGWLLESGRKILDLLFQAVQAAPFLIVLAILLFIAFAIFSQEGVMNWIDQELDGVIDWVYDIIAQLTGGA